MSTFGDNPSWLTNNLTAVEERNASECSGFSDLIWGWQKSCSQTTVHQAPISSPNETSREVDYLKSQLNELNDLRSAKAKLESTFAELNQKALNTAMMLAEARKNEKSRESLMSILKQEREALVGENVQLRKKTALSTEECERFRREVLKCKENETHLRQQLFEMEDQLTAIRRGDGIRAPSEKSVHTPTFIDHVSTSASSSVSVSSIPSFMNFQVEQAHDGELLCVAIPETGKCIWTGGAEKMIKGWDYTGRCISKIPLYGAPLCLFSGSDALIAGCSDSTIRVFDTSRLKERCQLTGHSEKIVSVVLCQDISKLFSTSTDRTIKRWNLLREELEHTLMCVSGCNDIFSVNDKLLAAHHDGSVRVWDSRSCQDVGILKAIHDKPITCVRAASEGLHVVTLSRDNTVKVSDLRMMKVVSTLTSDHLQVGNNWHRMDVSSDGQFCVCGSASGSLIFFTLHGSQSPKIFPSAHSGHIPAVFWNPDGRGVATIGLDKRLLFWK